MIKLPELRRFARFSAAIVFSPLRKLRARWQTFEQPAPAAPAQNQLRVATTGEISRELIARLRLKGRGEKWIKNLSGRLGIFCEAFPGHLDQIQSHEIDAWLLKLPVGERTRYNYYCAVFQIANYAQRQNYLDKKINLLEFVEEPEPPLTDIQIFTAEQARKLLAACPVELLGLLVLGLFAGIRHEEMSALNKKVLLRWEDVDLAAKKIYVDKRAAKTKLTREIEIHPNLAAWIASIPPELREGKICRISATANALMRLGRNCGVPWQKNGPRRTFITMRLDETKNIALTALEAGNSPQVIQASYKGRVTLLRSAEYFNIFPVPGERHTVQSDFGV